MFVTVFTYRARAGEESSVVALFDEWQRDRLPKVSGFQSGEVLRSIKDPQQFISIARFDSEAASQATANSPEQDSWYRKLVSLTEAEPVFTDCTVAQRTESRQETAVSL